MIAVVIPSYRVRAHVLGVLAGIGPEVEAIYVVDDRCPESSGDHVEENCSDPRVKVLRHAENQGVGGATMTGYAAAVRDGAEIIVKVDGDGQMDGADIPRLVRAIERDEADYVKGNRFYDLDKVRSMPGVRLLGNSLLSFITKLSSGYWNVFDPTNGFTAIHARVAERLPLDKISKRYFFESDILFRLNVQRAVVVDMPMEARYGDEESSLRIGRILGPFALGNAANTIKRCFYNYYLRDFSLASVQLVLGALALLFGVAFGVRAWMASSASGEVASAGTVMLAALPVIVGVQLILGFLSYDMQSTPRVPLHPRLDPLEPEGGEGARP